eukprot:CAMPEP_0194185280 /NCGR_PEP_ID=MMETSP0154-20130528/41941_1 /TAXON_ID=1049557 /ORGANISM="Thalassiothrix antarctica, Strain L6-D1" /LENGTH=700 /DNA_ID=CAMNT_0038903499 /DNA_START=142 /DNA_END=2244 /DNA_ORIENTATION=+
MFAGCCLPFESTELDSEVNKNIDTKNINNREKIDSILADDNVQQEDNKDDDDTFISISTTIPRMIGRLLRHKLEWTLANSPMKAMGRRNAAAVADGKRFIFIVGGYDGKTALKNVEQYDCASKKWKKLKGEFKHPVSGLAAVLTGGKILTFGGFRGSRRQASCFSYDIKTEKCHELPKMIHKRGGCASVVMNGGSMVCVIGGHDGMIHLDCAEMLAMDISDDASNSSESIGGRSQNSIVKSKHSKRTWSPLSDQMNEGRSNFGAVAINNIMYVVGGENDTGTLTSIEKFSDGKWSLLPAMKKPRRYCAVSVVEHFLVVVGGDNGGEEAGDDICVYDSCILFNTLTEEWCDELTTMPSMNISRTRTSAVVIHSRGKPRIHVMGGSDKTKRCLSSMETCDVFHTVPMPPAVNYPPEMKTLNNNNSSAASTSGKKKSCTNDDHLIRDSIAMAGWIDETNAAVNSYKSSIKGVAKQVNADHAWKEKELKKRIMVLKTDIRKAGLMRDAFLSDLDKLTNNWFKLQEKRVERSQAQLHSIGPVEVDSPTGAPIVSATPMTAAMKMATTDNATSTTTNNESKKNGSAPNSIKSRKSSNDIPEELKCPISMELMKDPVIAADGVTYERSAIQHVLMSAGTTSTPSVNSKNGNISNNPAVVLSPKTNEPLDNHELISNHNMREMCREYGVLGMVEETREDQESERIGFI